MRFSALTQRIAGDGAAAWNLHYRAQAMAAAGRDVLLLSVGDPDFDTPPVIRDAAIDALTAGRTHYASVQGNPDLRQAIARQHSARCGQPVEADRVTVLAGAQCAVYAVAHCLFDPGDEVLVAEPMYVTYEAVFGSCGARMVPVPARPEAGFRLDPADVEARIGPRTRGILINSPHNPSGASLSLSALKAIAALCIRHDLWLISDEVYGQLQFDGQAHSVLAIPEVADRAVVIDSLSKSHAMSGWRVGWAIGPLALSEHLTHLALCMLYGLPDFIQDAARVALESAQDEVQRMREVYRDRAERVVAALSGQPGIRVQRPDGGMFVMVDIRQTGVSAGEFAERLLEDHGVSVLAGEAFGPSAAGHLRMGLVVEAALLERACHGIARCARALLEAAPGAAVRPVRYAGAAPTA